MSGKHHHDHNHGHNGEHDHHGQGSWRDMFSRESWRATAANFRGSELPWHRTLLVAASNYWRKVRGLQRCCGNTGHPGC